MTDGHTTAGVKPHRSLPGTVAYAALFAVGLPLALLAWMDRLDALVSLPGYDAPIAGAALAAAGAGLMAAAVVALWRFGHGLPMSPFPPERFVTRGVYGVIADPLYLGAVVACLGVALARHSPAGVWIVTPVLALAATAFVWGYERHATRRHFGPQPPPWLRLPPAADDPVRFRDWLSFGLLVLVPWLVMYEGISRVARDTPAWSTYLPGEYAWPVTAWTEPIYGSAYVLTALLPLAARRQRDLRQLALRGVGATIGVGLFYLLVPLVAPYKPAPAGSIWTPLLAMERFSDQRACALPSFHVLWACLVADLAAVTWPRWRAAAWAGCIAIAVSCATTGMHSVLDVVAGFAAYLVVARGSRIWAWLCGRAEAAANSWREWRVGPLRIINHGAYAAAGAALGAGVAVCLAGMDYAWWIVGLTLAAELGSGLWAQLVEGSPQLLRPYGYFGGVLAIVALGSAAGVAGRDPWLLLGAMATGGCLTQILGRIRCLVQGCCHGAPVDAPWGIRHTHPRSRVVRLSELGGRRLHPTPLYSMLGTGLVFCVLVRLWLVGVPAPFVGGTYLLLVGLGRFVEEHYRGEPQTAEIRGLHLYQWLALLFVIAGAVVTCVGGSLTPGPVAPTSLLWALLAGVFVLTWLAFGVDFPRSDKRFSRLV